MKEEEISAALESGGNDIIIKIFGSLSITSEKRWHISETTDKVPAGTLV